MATQARAHDRSHVHEAWHSKSALNNHPAALIWNGPITYDFGPQHPLQPVRVELAVELMRAYGLLSQPNVELIPPRLATDAELRLIHTPDYIEAVQRASILNETWMSMPEYCLGPGDNPIFPDMHDASADVVGGSLEAAEYVMRGGQRHAFAIGGGLHHAMSNRASGFCIYNDGAVAIEHLRRKYDLRIVYLDTDVHHGDGVQAAFYHTDQVLTISFHESGKYLFPGTGFVNETGMLKGKGYSVNVPLPPKTGDDAYRMAFDALVPDLIRAFKPDLIVNQNGADAHLNDPLAHLRGTTALQAHIARTVHDLSHELCDGRWLALGGGGYDLFDAVPRSWALVFAELSGAGTPAQELPEAWIEFDILKGGSHPPNQLLDEPTTSDEREISQVAAIIREVREAIPLIHV